MIARFTRFEVAIKEVFAEIENWMIENLHKILKSKAHSFKVAFC